MLALSSSMKVIAVIPGGDFRFNCFLQNREATTQVTKDGSKELSNDPFNYVLDLKVICPVLNRYWYDDA